MRPATEEVGSAILYLIAVGLTGWALAGINELNPVFVGFLSVAIGAILLLGIGHYE